MTKRITPPAGQPLTAAVEGDVIVVRIGVASFANAAMSHDHWPDNRAIVDPWAFAAVAAKGLPSALQAFDIVENVGFYAEHEGAAVSGVTDGDADVARAQVLALAEPRLPAQIEDVRGVLHRQDAKGGWLPEENFRPADVIQDELVRETIAAAKARAGGLSEFRDETLARVAEFQALLDQEYGVGKGGAKGNVTLTTIHPTMRMEVRVNELIVFGPELKQAKALIDECLSEWAADAHAIIRALVLRAFNVEQEGHANRGELLGLMRMEVDDARWQRAMKAIRDSIRVDGTKTYVRFQERDTIEDAWRTISLDIARA